MASEKTKPPKPTTTVRELSQLSSQRLKLTLRGGEDGLDNPITSPRIQKLGLALAGYVDYLHAGRVLLVGRTEINYLKTLSAADRKTAIKQIFSRKLSCVVITSDLKTPVSLLHNCEENKVPLFRTKALSSIAITEISDFLEEQLALRSTIHGVLMEVYGLGLLLLGPSGIGKSECALDLILRGHRLVSDDMIVIRKFGSDRLMGSGPSDFRFHMELRGLGIVNIKELFGISVLSPKTIIDIAIDLDALTSPLEIGKAGLSMSSEIHEPARRLHGYLFLLQLLSCFRGELFYQFSHSMTELILVGIGIVSELADLFQLLRALLDEIAFFTHADLL